MDKLILEGDESMDDKNKQGKSLMPDFDSVSPKSALTPPTQPLPKDQSKASTNDAKNIGSTKDSDPTM
jgi:hypothetical protein